MNMSRYRTASFNMNATCELLMWTRSCWGVRGEGWYVAALAPGTKAVGGGRWELGPFGSGSSRPDHKQPTFLRRLHDWQSHEALAATVPLPVAAQCDGHGRLSRTARIRPTIKHPDCRHFFPRQLPIKTSPRLHRALQNYTSNRRCSSQALPPQHALLPGSEYTSHICGASLQWNISNPKHSGNAASTAPFRASAMEIISASFIRLAADSQVGDGYRGGVCRLPEKD